MSGQDAEYLGSAERRERHRVRPLGAELRAGVEPGERLLPGSPRRGRGRRRCPVPAGHAPRSRQCPVRLSTAVVAEVVAEPAVVRLCLHEEIEVAPRKRDELMARRGLPAHDGQPVRGVVHAVAALMPRHDAVGVLKQADVIGDPDQVAERRIGAVHDRARCWSRLPRPGSEARPGVLTRRRWRSCGPGRSSAGPSRPGGLGRAGKCVTEQPGAALRADQHRQPRRVARQNA